MTDAYLRATKTRRDEIVGKGVFEVFPDNPRDPETNAVDYARASFRRVVESGAIDVMGVRKHDIQRPASEGGGFEERLWDAVNFPVLGPDGEVVCIIHRVEDVTEAARLKQSGIEQQVANARLRESRRAALNLMQDAVAARHQAEQANLVSEIVERRRADEALKQSEERYHRLFEMESDTVLMLDLESNCFIDINIAALGMYGYTKQEFLQLKPADLSAEPLLTDSRHPDLYPTAHAPQKRRHGIPG